MTVNDTKETQEDKDRDWVTPWFHSTFTCPGLDAHNRSIEWVAKAAKEVGATIHTDNPSHHGSYGWVNFDIGIQGRESGVRYKISVRYHAERAEKLAIKIDEIMELNRGCPITNSVLKDFVKGIKFMRFNVYYEDIDGDSAHICIEPGDDGFGLWPGDDIRGVMLCLHDDMTTAFDPVMYTLRGAIEEASMNSYLEGRCNIPLDRLVAYFQAFSRVSNASRGPNKNSKAERIAAEYRSKFKDPEYAGSPTADGHRDEVSEFVGGFEGLGSLFG